MKLHWQILIAIGLAIVVGLFLDPSDGIGDFTFYGLFQFLGSLFLNALHMIVVPLIISSIICGVASAGVGENLTRMGGKTIALFMLSTLFATLLGLVLVNLTMPGIIDGQPAGAQLNLVQDAALNETLAKVEGRGAGDIAEVFLRMIPTNVIAAAAEGEMLGLIFFSMLFGYFMMRIEHKYSQTLLNFWQGVFEVMMGITMLVMKFAPLGVFALVAKTVVATGFSAFIPLLVFFLTVAVGLVLHTFVTLGLMLRYIGKVNPMKHYRAMFPAMLTAFSTASSSATLPVNIRCLEDNVGVSPRTTSFVLPLGATINMDGTALYECVAALFIAQAYGMDLSFGQQFLIVILALLTSIGVAGIPAASLVAISVILTAMGLPLEGIGLLLVTDRILDMMRTAVNIFSDSCCAVMVARLEGETGMFADPSIKTATE
jgi:proton glutamate symport protein